MYTYIHMYKCFKCLKQMSSPSDPPLMTRVRTLNHRLLL